MGAKRKPRIKACFSYETKDGRPLDAADFKRLSDNLTQAILDKAEPSIDDFDTEEGIILVQS